MAHANTVPIGIAGVHHVVFELSRRGLVALPTTRNTAAYDILVVRTDGRRHANIQVKTSQKKAPFFRMPPSHRVKVGPRDFYVLLRWRESEARYEGFLLAGREARAEVRRTEKRQRGRIRSGRRRVLVPVVHVTGAAEQRAKRWKNRWRTWTL